MIEHNTVSSDSTSTVKRDSVTRTTYDSVSSFIHDSLVHVDQDEAIEGYDTLAAVMLAIKQAEESSAGKASVKEVVLAQNGRAKLSTNGRSIKCTCDSLEIVVNDLRSVVRISNRSLDSVTTALQVEKGRFSDYKFAVKNPTILERIFSLIEGALAVVGLIAIVLFTVKKFV